MPENKTTINNPYFIGQDKSRKLSIEQLRAAKFNSQFALSIFANLVKTGGHNPEAAINSAYLPGILSGNLPKSDKETGLPSNDLANKIKCLLLELKKPGGPEKFQKTFFYQIVDRCRLGTTSYIKSELWVNHKEKAGCEEKYKGKDPFFAAVLCHSRNNDRPVGLDFSKLIDCLMTPDGMGGYKMYTDFNSLSEKGTQVSSACSEYLKLLRENPTFLKNFEYVAPEKGEIGPHI